MNPTLCERFQGCLLGQAIGDGLGAMFEGQDGAWVRSRFSGVSALLAYPQDELWYTDDTQMAIGVAETLAEHGQVIEEKLCQAFVSNYEPERGYGSGARRVLGAMRAGQDYRKVAAETFPGGSFGNGAAMRVAPVGLFFRDNPAQVLEQARLSAWPTHHHPLGIEGAQLLALAVSLVCRDQVFDRSSFFSTLLATAQALEYRTRLEQAVTLPADRLGLLGYGIAAQESVVTAITSFALAPNSFEETIGRVILLGGDTDTLAAMAGALSGAYLGIHALPQRLLGLLENKVKGRQYLLALAERLCSAAQRATAGK